MKFQEFGKSTILAAALCLAAVTPAWATAVSYEYDWVQTSGSPTFSGYLLLDAPSGTGVAASTAIVGWSISDGHITWNPSDSWITDGSTEFLTWGSVAGGASQITLITPFVNSTLFILEFVGGGSLSITADSITENFDPGGGFYLNGVTPGSTVPDSFNTAGLLGIGLAGLALFYSGILRARRRLIA